MRLLIDCGCGCSALAAKLPAPPALGKAFEKQRGKDTTMNAKDRSPKDNPDEEKFEPKHIASLR